MRKQIAALLVAALTFTMVFGTGGAAVYAVDPPTPVMISDTAGLVAAIEAQKTDSTPGQTWILAPGTYDLPRFTDAQVPKASTGNQDLWYFPIILEGLTVRGDGTGEVILTSTTWSDNGNWPSQDFIAIWANGVTIEDVTIIAKRNTNKAIEVMGKDFTLRGATLLTNPLGPWEGEDYYKFSGSVYFNPQLSVTGLAGDAGDSRLEDVYLEGAWVSAGASTVTTGSVTLNSVTLDWIEAGYAPYGYGMVSANPLIIAESDVLFIADDTMADLEAQATSRMPVGATLDFYGAAKPDAEIPIGVFTALKRDGSYPADGDLYLSYESTVTPGLFPYSWWFGTGFLDEDFDTTFYPAVDVRTTVETLVGDMQASADLPDDGTDVIEVDCVHAGSLPGPGALTVYADPALAGKEFALYQYDPAGGTHLVDMVQTATVDEYGYVTVSIDSGDVWYLIELAEPWPSGRVWGTTRYLTNAAISLEHFDMADTAIVVTGRGFADALSASGLAGIYNAPILLTDSTTLSPHVASELDRLGVTHVIVCGGTLAVSGDVMSAIDALPGVSVERIGGTSRYATSRLIAERITDEVGSTPLTVLARGDVFADALSVSPIAWANGLPVLLTTPGTLAADAAAFLTAETPGEAVLLGGITALSGDVESAVDALVADVDRVSGTSRYGTAVAIAEWAYLSGLADRQYVGVATGVNFPDALSAGAGVGARGGVLVLTQKSVAPDPTRTFVTVHSTDIATLQVFGGTVAVEDAVMDDLLSLAGITP